MTPPPVDRGESTAGDAHRSLPTPFLTKTYQLVEDQSIDDIISWNEDGSAFIVWNPTEFARDLLPKYFKHNNFSSFVRQLNTYGFRKLVPDRWEFSNDCFKRGEKRLLCDIQRRKISAAVTASTPPVVVPAPTLLPIAAPPPRMASPSASGEEQVFSSSNSPAAQEFSGDGSDLVGENERLRKENSQLNKELTQMKSLCNNIYDLMSGFNGEKPSSSNTDQQGDSCKSDLVENTVKEPLDLLPMNSSEDMEIVEVRGVGEESCIRSAAEEIGARLFGVPIGSKRGREGEGTSADHDMELQLQQPGGDIKSEASDQDDADDRDAAWLIRNNSRNQRACN